MVLRKLLPVLLLLCFFAAALPSAASANLWAKSKISCPATGQIAAIDPLGAPGVSPTSHPHFFAGAKNVTPNTTTADLLNAESTCFLNSDHAGIWAPTMVKDGVGYGVNASYYLAANGADPAHIAGGRIQTPDNGLRYVVGNPNSTVTQGANVVRWRCGESVYTSAYPPTTENCSSYFYMELDGPSCWDGMRLDSPNHKDHVSGPSADGGCPAATPMRIPQVQIAFAYPAAARGGRLSCDAAGADAGACAHFDYWFANGPEIEQLTRCLNDPGRNSPNSPSCGVLTYFSTNAGTPYEQPNPWRVAMTQWSTIGYVLPNGNANGPPPAGTP